MQQTSLEAYWNFTKPKLNERQKAVLEALEEIFPASNKQLAEHLQWPINSITPRVLELRTKGVVVKAYTGKDLTGRSQNYWTPKQSKEWTNE